MNASVPYLLLSNAKELIKIYSFVYHRDACGVWPDCLVGLETSCGRTAELLLYLLKEDNALECDLNHLDEYVSNGYLVQIQLRPMHNDSDLETHTMLCCQCHQSYLILDSYLSLRTLHIRHYNRSQFLRFIDLLSQTSMTPENWCEICQIQTWPTMKIDQMYNQFLLAYRLTHDPQPIISRIRTLCRKAMEELDQCPDYCLYVFHEDQNLVTNHEDNFARSLAWLQKFEVKVTFDPNFSFK